MWQFKERIIKTPVEITIGDVTYPKQIFTKWSKDELAELGITPYEPEATPDQRYYWDNGTAKDIEQLKANMVSKVRDTCASLCSKYDWMNHRENDGGQAVAQEIKDYRNALRAESNSKELLIDVITTIDEVILFEATPFTEVRKVKHTSDEGVETYGPELEEPMTRHIDMTRHYEAVDPNGEVDPAFVSLTKE